MNITVSGNSAVQGGGGIGACGTETIVNSIVAGNTAAVGPDIDCFADTITTSVIGVPSGMTLADILVPGGPANYGGPTQTIALALVVGNPAIDSGHRRGLCGAPVNGLDQRGLPRPAACDIGAYEAQPPSVAAQPNVSATATSAAGAVVNYTSPAGTDEQGGTAAVACLPASGSTFAVGSTTVTCTATDAVGHTGSGTFSVNVAVPAGSPDRDREPDSHANRNPWAAAQHRQPERDIGTGLAFRPHLPSSACSASLPWGAGHGRGVRPVYGADYAEPHLVQKRGRSGRVEGQDELAGRARECDVGEATLLLERAVGIIRVGEGSPVRDPIGLEADQDHGLPFTALRGMHRRQLDGR